MKPKIKLASGRTWDVPMFDPVVARHFTNPASNTATLLSEVNDKQIYKKLFAGRKDLTFLDIGANIGLVSIYAAGNCARIVAVEPAPQTFEVLKAVTLKFNQIECVQAALAPTDGPCEFFTNRENTTASSTVNTFGEFGSVNGLKLSSILRIYQLERVDVCKCDSEGSEGESLTFEELEAAAPIIKQWYIECHNYPRVEWQDVQMRLVTDLSRLGYKVQTEGMKLVAIS